MRQQKHIIKIYEAGLQRAGRIDACVSHLMLYLSAALQKQVGKHRQWKQEAVGVVEAMEDAGHSHSETFQRRESSYRGYENNVSLYKDMTGWLVRGGGSREDLGGCEVRQAALRHSQTGSHVCIHNLGPCFWRWSMKWPKMRISCRVADQDVEPDNDGWVATLMRMQGFV